MRNLICYTLVAVIILLATLLATWPHSAGRGYLPGPELQVLWEKNHEPAR